MEKLVSGAEGYLEKESKRYVGAKFTSNKDISMILKCHVQPSLASILQKRGLSPAKLDEIKIKANILKAFVAEEAEEAEAKVESFARKATAEL